MAGGLRKTRHRGHFFYTIAGKEAEAILTGANIILDGISGTGLKGALSGAAAECARWLSGTDSLVVAVDSPSGVGDDFRGDFPVVCADLTFYCVLREKLLFTIPLPDLFAEKLFM